LHVADLEKILRAIQSCMISRFALDSACNYYQNRMRLIDLSRQIRFLIDH